MSVIRNRSDQSSDRKRLCAFCGWPLCGVDRASEHIIPAWLQRRQDVASEIARFTSFDIEGVPTEHRIQSMDSFRFGRVCERCNNGWMRELEHKVMPFLPQLIEGTCHADALIDDDKLGLARWVAKTAYCLDAGLLAEPLVPDRHHKILWRHEDRLPQGVLVTAAVSPFSVPFDFFEMRNCTNRTLGGDLESKERRLRREFERSYKVGFQFGTAILIVSFWPNLDEHITLVRGLHQVIWTDRITVYDRNVSSRIEPCTNNSEFLATTIESIGTCTREPHQIASGEGLKRMRLDRNVGDGRMRGGRAVPPTKDDDQARM